MILNDGIWEWRYKPKHNKDTGYDDVVRTYNIISVDKFKKLPEEEQQKYVYEIIHRIREINVYPIYYYKDYGVREEILKCFMHEVDFSGDELSNYGRAGSTLLDFLFPNLHLAHSGTSVNNHLYSRFFDDSKLAVCITRHMKNYKFTSMRTPFFMYGRYFWSTAMNFSPMRAKAIYARFCKPGDHVYDFSAGYGARMLGALSNGKIPVTYIGCEPNVNTAHNLNKLGTYIEQMSKRQDSYKIHMIGSEDLVLPDESIDFAFSCPPYYGLERYSDEETQSFVRFPKYDDWLNGYALKTLENVYNALKPGATMGFIINNVWYKNVYYPLVEDWHRLALAVGFKFVQSFPIRSTSRKTNVEALHTYIKEA